MRGASWLLTAGTAAASRPGPERLALMAKRPNGAMLLHPLGDWHPDQVGPYLTQMATGDIATVAAEVFEMVEKEEMQ